MEHNQLTSEKAFSYSGKRRVAYLFVYAVFLYLAFPVCLLSLLIMIADVMFVLFTPNPASELIFNLEDLRTILIVGLWSYVVPQIQFNLFSNFRVSENGIWIQTFFFRYRWKFVEWENIADITKSKIPTVNLWPVWVVHVKELDLWHKLLSLFYLVGLRPGFAITPGISNYDDLLQIVEAHLSKN